MLNVRKPFDWWTFYGRSMDVPWTISKQKTKHLFIIETLFLYRNVSPLAFSSNLTNIKNNVKKIKGDILWWVKWENKIDIHIYSIWWKDWYRVFNIKLNADTVHWWFWLKCNNRGIGLLHQSASIPNSTYPTEKVFKNKNTVFRIKGNNFFKYSIFSYSLYPSLFNHLFFYFCISYSV